MDKIFFWWMILASGTLLLESIGKGDLAILVAVLMVPIFIHDILIKFCKFCETKQENLTHKE